MNPSLLPGLLPPVCMLVAVLISGRSSAPPARTWQRFLGLSWLSLAGSLLTLVAWFVMPPVDGRLPGEPWLRITALGAVMAVLVQGLATVIGAFSARYLQGEPGQPRYVGALAAVVGAVQVLLLADHWLVLIVAWAAVGWALERLLCFYPDRPFALLAAHKKRLADRCADALLAGAAVLAWQEVGSGSFSALSAHLAVAGASPALQGSALLLVGAVLLRTAMLPVHGWLIQVMEAPTPVSGLLHAGVVNLGGFVLIRFAPLLEQAMPARWLLVVLGLGTALLAGLVMLTRVSIKVRLAWSTVAQMGFMLMEVGLGLYTLAALHLVGHSLYKAQAFLWASGTVRDTRLQALRPDAAPGAASLLLAPLAAGLVLVGLAWLTGGSAWPAWWTAVLALAWAPLLWRAPGAGAATSGSGLLLVAGLGLLAQLAHRLPLGLVDAPHPVLGAVAVGGLAVLYALSVLLHLAPGALSVGRRWSYAGFYLDEAITRLTLRLWPARWTAPSPVAEHRFPPGR